MGQATFLDIIKAIRRLSFKQILSSCEYYQWEIAGFIIMSFMTGLFVSLFSTVYLYLLCSYFWCWTLASPKLIWKTEGKRYRFSLLRAIVNFERKMRQAFLFKGLRTNRFYRPTGRVISIFILGLFISLILKGFVLPYFILGALWFEIFRAIKFFQQESV